MCFGIHRKLTVVRGAKPSIAHLHYAGIRIRRRHPSLVFFCRWLLRRDSGHLLQGRLDPTLAILGRTLTGCRLTAIRRVRILLELRTQTLHLLLSFLPTTLQTRLTTKRGCASTRTHMDAVLGHPLQRHQLLRHQHRNTLSQHLIEKFPMLNSKVRQGVMVHRYTAQDPAIRIVLTSQPLQRSRAADSLDRGVQPQGHVNPRIDRRTTGTPLN